MGVTASPSRGSILHTRKRAPGRARLCSKARCRTAEACGSAAGDKDGDVRHRPGRDLTYTVPKSVLLVTLVGGDTRIVDAHDRAVEAMLARSTENDLLITYADDLSGFGCCIRV